MKKTIAMDNNYNENLISEMVGTLDSLQRAIKYITSPAMLYFSRDRSEQTFLNADISGLALHSYLYLE